MRGAELGLTFDGAINPYVQDPGERMRYDRVMAKGLRPVHIEMLGEIAPQPDYSFEEPYFASPKRDLPFPPVPLRVALASAQLWVAEGVAGVCAARGLFALARAAQVVVLAAMLACTRASWYPRCRTSVQLCGFITRLCGIITRLLELASERLF